jgi:hypothetical protein
MSLRSPAAVQRLLERAAADTLRLGNGVARNRTLATIASAALRACEVSELEQRIAALETRVAAHERQRRGPVWRSGIA